MLQAATLCDLIGFADILRCRIFVVLKSVVEMETLYPCLHLRGRDIVPVFRAADLC